MIERDIDKGGGGSEGDKHRKCEKREEFSRQFVVMATVFCLLVGSAHAQSPPDEMEGNHVCKYSISLLLIRIIIVSRTLLCINFFVEFHEIHQIQAFEFYSVFTVRDFRK